MNRPAIAAALSVLCLTRPALAAGPDSGTADLERGRYLVRVSGCNDCHTPGYLQADGKVPESQWLTGNRVGFQGPWGTTYPANLRHTVHDLTEEDWLARARQPMRPPMPWFNLSAMTDDDLRALYRYIRHLGDAGEPAPAAVPPGAAVSTPYIDFTARNLDKVAAR